MGVISLIVRKDMKRRLRSPVAIICMLLIPLGLTLIIGLVFGRHGDVSIEHITVLLVDRDKGFAANFLKQGMKQGKLAELIDLVEVDSAEGHALMEAGKASALLEIPPDFTSRILDRKPTELAIVKNPREVFLPVIAEEIVGTMAVLMDGTVRIFGGSIDRARALIEAGRWPSGDDLARLVASARPRIELVKGYLADSLISLATETVSDPADAPKGTFNFFALIMPGSILIGLLFISEITMRDFLREREAGTLARTLAGPVGSARVVAAKVASSFMITLVSCVLLIAVGHFGFGILWGNPLQLAALLIGSILMCVGIMTFIYGVVSSERAADAVLPVIIVVICIFGGAMFPYEIMGAAMQKAARFSPAFWVIDGVKKISLEKAGWGALATHFAVVYGIGALGIVAGARRLRARVGGGG